MAKPRITVGDTGGLLSLALPLVSPSYDHEAGIEPFGLFLANYDVRVPKDVYDELYGLASEADGTVLGSDDPPTSPTGSQLTAAAAEVVTKAEGSGYAVSDPYSTGPDHDDPPEWGLDPGETAAIVQANHAAADGLVSDDFKSKTAILRSLNDGIEWLSSFDVLVEMKENGLFSKREGRNVANVIVDARNWDNQAYAQKVILKHL